MKKLLTLALLVTFFSCDKADPEPETGIPATNTNPNTPGEKEELPWWYIPNWRHGDTLESVITQNGQITGLDTIYTYVEGNATMIVYQGKKYYIWKQAKYKEEKLIPDQNGYTNCIVSPTVDAEDALNKGVECIVWPHRYKDENGLWKYQKQVVTFNGNLSAIKGNAYAGI